MNHLDESQLTRYIEGTISDEKLKKEIRTHLKECVQCFNRYIDLKETIYFMTKGDKMPDTVLEKIISLEKKEPKRKLSLIVYYTKKAMRVFSEDNFELKSRFIDVSYAVRGEEKKDENEDGIILFKKIGDYKVTLNIIKQPVKNYFTLAVDVLYKEEKASNITVFLKENQIEIESIDLDKKNQFLSELDSSSYEMVFISQEEELFSINLKLQEES